MQKRRRTQVQHQTKKTNQQKWQACITNHSAPRPHLKKIAFPSREATADRWVTESQRTMRTSSSLRGAHVVGGSGIGARSHELSHQRA